jgi:ubiquinol-cytochrome c reductase cytochrome b subunit
MFSALLALLALPRVDFSRTRGIQFKPLSKIIFFVFIANFLLLMVLGAKHVEAPFIELGMACTALYFLFFLGLIPIASLLENTVLIWGTKKDQVI